MTKLKVSEKDLFWYLLSENYSELCWIMIDDMFRKRISYKKLDAYMELIMNHVPFEPGMQMFVTWARNMPLDTSKMTHFDIWHPKYGPAIIERSQKYKDMLKGYARG